jgi:hypothetical protein
MTIRRRNVAEGEIGPEILSRSFREARYGFETFSRVPHSFDVAAGFGTPVGSAGHENAFFTGANTWLWHVLGTQTLLIPVLTTDGFYNFGLDQTLADGWELLVGGAEGVTTGGNVPTHYTVGTDEAFFRLLFSAEDVSGAHIVIGFRKVEAFQDDYNDYDELAGVEILGDSSSAAGAISIVSILNNATTSSTDTTDTLADATAVEVMVKIVGRTVRFEINGAPPTVDVTDFQFDSGEVVQPFVFFLNTTDVVGELKLRRAEWGLLADKPQSTITVP